jgi:hypothetical protein
VPLMPLMLLMLEVVVVAVAVPVPLIWAENGNSSCRIYPFS